MKNLYLLIGCVLIWSVACQSNTPPSPTSPHTPTNTLQPLPTQIPASPLPTPQVTNIPPQEDLQNNILPASFSDETTTPNFDSQSATYFNLINNTLLLNEDELALLNQNGFVITERLQWRRFAEAYAWIYKHDLPVVVTSDSILHAVHQSYANLLQEFEGEAIHPELVTMLTATRDQVKADARQVTDSELASLYQDVSDYLTIAIILAKGEAMQVRGEPYSQERYGNYPTGEIDVTLNLAQIAHYYSPQMNDLVQLVWEANTATDLSASDPVTLDLFNNSRSVDFTLFQPRAHYNNTLHMTNYFRAMMWLSQIDYRFVEFHPITNNPILNHDSVVAGKILQEAIDKSGQRERFNFIDNIFAHLVGQSDNTTLTDLDQLSLDMNWSSPADVKQTDPNLLLDQLLTYNYGQQRITGQIIGRHVNNTSDQPIPRPVSFMLIGQRFTLDSWILGNVVYDRIIHEGMPVERALPTGFDVMFALGNDHALTHLQPELEKYPYEAQLIAIRQNVDNLDDSYWQTPIYNQWLRMIRGLNAPTTSEQYPATMRTDAWADKNLQTQLASWAQLRHDNILYAKQSYTTFQIECEFPSVYVEPYPELYLALYDFARHGQSLTSAISSRYPEEAQKLQTYFTNVADSAQYLVTISQKELTQTPLTAEEDLFLKSLVVEQEVNTRGCGGPAFEEAWDGWYMHMIYGKDKTPALIADIHTNPTNDPRSDLYPPRVLHAGTGPTAAIFMIIEINGEPTLYVGPAFTYYEFAEEGFPPVRLNDQAWGTRLYRSETVPTPPNWVTTFRLPVTTHPDPLLIPR